MIEFKENPLDIGEIEKNSTTLVTFEFTGDPEDIVHMSPGCGCTAQCTVVGNTIQAWFTEDAFKTLDPKIAKTHYPSGYFTFIKNIDVYLKDNEDLIVINGVEKDYNPNKQKITLNFKGKIKLD